MGLVKFSTFGKKVKNVLSMSYTEKLPQLKSIYLTLNVGYDLFNTIFFVGMGNFLN